MNDQSGQGSTRDEQIGSMGVEAAKLLAALSEWASTQGHDVSATAGRAAHGLVDAMHGVGEEIATDAPDCRYCPICQAIHAVRQTPPEVKTHLAVAADALLKAAAGFLETHVPAPSAGTRESGEPVQRIEIDPDSGDTT